MKRTKLLAAVVTVALGWTIAAVAQQPFETRNTPPESKEAQLKVLSPAYAPVNDLASSLSQVFNGVMIVPDPASNSVILRGDADELAQVEALAMKLDEAAKKHQDTAGPMGAAALAPPRVRAQTPGVDPIQEDPQSRAMRMRGRGFGFNMEGGRTLMLRAKDKDYVYAEAEKQASEAEKMANEVAAKIRELAEGAKTAQEVPQVPHYVEIFDEKQQPKLAALKAELKKEVEKAFDERQKSQAAELEKLRKRLEEIEKTISNRKKNREAIVNRRVEELINPDLRWDDGAAAPGPQSNAVFSPFQELPGKVIVRGAPGLKGPTKIAVPLAPTPPAPPAPPARTSFSVPEPNPTPEPKPTPSPSPTPEPDPTPKPTPASLPSQ